MSAKKTDGKAANPIGKVLDTVKIYFSDEKKMTDADAKNSESVIAARNKNAEAWRELALDKDTPYDDRSYFLQNASAETDKAQTESAAERASNERRSIRKSEDFKLLCLTGIAVLGGLGLSKLSPSAKESLTKLLPGNKK